MKLLVAMTGKASAAKTALGDEPVFAYTRQAFGRQGIDPLGDSALRLRQLAMFCKVAKGQVAIARVNLSRGRAACFS